MKRHFECPKCGTKGVKVLWEESSKSLECRCLRCQCWWMEEPNDAMLIRKVGAALAARDAAAAQKSAGESKAAEVQGQDEPSTRTCSTCAYVSWDVTRCHRHGHGLEQLPVIQAGHTCDEWEARAGTAVCTQDDPWPPGGIVTAEAEATSDGDDDGPEWHMGGHYAEMVRVGREIAQAVSPKLYSGPCSVCYHHEDTADSSVVNCVRNPKPAIRRAGFTCGEWRSR